MLFKIEFEINQLPKLINANGRVHWTLKMKEAKKWRNLVHAAALEKTSGHAPELEKAKLTLTRYSSREPDADGLVSGFKHVIDGLVQARIIINDKMSNIGFPDYKWKKASPGKGKIKIRIEEI